MLLGLTRRTGYGPALRVPPESAVAAGGRCHVADRRSHPEPFRHGAPHDDGLAVPGADASRGGDRGILTDVAAKAAHKLSGGQTQRVRFAISLVSNPDLMVLDEPTVALDVKGEACLLGHMRGLASQGRTVIFATHYLEEADAFADRIVSCRAVDRGRRVDVRDQGHGQRSDDPRHAVRRSSDSRAAARGEPGGTPDTVSVYSAALTRCCGLLIDYPEARDIEVTGSGLDAAPALTGGPSPRPSNPFRRYQ